MTPIAAWLSLALAASAPLDSSAISGLGARNIGSARMSGRIAAVTGRVEPDGNVTLFVGAASGGVWKSTDNGTTFKPMFDRQDVQSIGAIALDPTNPKVVWVGTGEAWTRNSVSVGDGVYKSMDGGETWTHMGLPASERIAKILVSPRDGNTVYVCVPGKLWSDSAERGLYKTTDGGKSWSQVLKGPNLSTGCSSIAMDPAKPERLFAALWDFRRKGWTFRSGGENANAPSGSGLFVSEDGGAHWKVLDATTAPGLPKGPWGRSAVAIAPSDSRVVYAVIEGTRSALFRSSDGGKTWEERDRSQSMVWRPFYFSNLIVDPKNPDRLFKPNLSLIVSDDGGKSFSNVSGGTHGDHHDVWIDPTNPKHVVTGDDGGLWISYDGGNKWWKVNSLPVSQFYHVTVDNQDPYHVYGGLQDNSAWVGDSAYPGGISNSRWENINGGDGFWAIPDPTDPNVIFTESQGGYAVRVNHGSLQGRDIQPKAGPGEKLRFNWNTPMYVSKKGTLYLGAQFLFRSRDRGTSWERISPDLTTNDPEKQKQEQSGGITVDNSAAEMHTTIYAVAESPKNPQLVWAGTDDGNLQLTRNGGKQWTNVVGNVPGLPRFSWVSSVEPGHNAECTAYATFDRHTFGELEPWAFKTADCGKSWTRIAGPDQGIRGYAHVIREDPANTNVLYLGTEFGLWISIDGGQRWAEFKGSNFPAVSVRDLAIQERDSDLVIATHGRGIWIIDDLTPLRNLKPEILEKPLAFLPSRPVQQRFEAGGGWAEGDATFIGSNPPGGAVITYYQRTRHVFGRMKIEVLDDKGKLIETLPASKRKGLNRVVWSMHVAPPRVPTAAQAAGANTGPRVVPGTYRVRLTDGDKVYETKLDVGLDRRAKFTVADRRAQYDAAMKAHGLFGKMSEVVDQLNGLKALAQERAHALKPGDELAGKLGAFAEKLEALRKEIVATTEGGAITGEERLREHLGYAYDAILSDEGRPSDYQVKRVDVLAKQLEGITSRQHTLVDQELPPLNEALKQRALPLLSSAEAQEAGERLAAIREYQEALHPEPTGVARGERD